MAATDKVSMVITGHGAFETEAGSLDDMMAKYLPASASELRAKILELTGEGGCEGHYDDDATLLSDVGIGEETYCDGSCVTTYRDMTSVIECLIYLADLHGRGTK